MLVSHLLTSLVFVLAALAEEPWLEVEYADQYAAYRARRAWAVPLGCQPATKDLLLPLVVQAGQRLEGLDYALSVVETFTVSVRDQRDGRRPVVSGDGPLQGGDAQGAPQREALRVCHRPSAEAISPRAAQRRSG